MSKVKVNSFQEALLSETGFNDWDVFFRIRLDQDVTDVSVGVVIQDVFEVHINEGLEDGGCIGILIWHSPDNLHRF